MVGGAIGFIGGVAVTLVSRRLRHAGEIRCIFSPITHLALCETGPSTGSSGTALDLCPIESATHVVYFFAVEFFNGKDLDVALSRVAVVFERDGREVITDAPGLVSQASPLAEPYKNVEPIGTIHLPSRTPVDLQMKGYLRNVGDIDALDQIRAGYDRVLFRATREDGKTVFRRIIGKRFEGG